MINNNKKILSDMPIAGQSLTHELGARPWQSPPQYTIQLGGVMEGLHTIDVGVIISPVIAEILIGLAESAEIEYTVEDEDMEEKKKPTEADVAVAIDDMDSDTTKPIVEENMVIDEEEPKGLMARRNNDGI